MKPTTSFSMVTAVDNNTAKMSKQDLQGLIRAVKEQEAKVQILKEALDAERNVMDSYMETVDKLIATNHQEREAMLQHLAKLEKAMNRPKLEGYGGYNTDKSWEAGIRLVIPLSLRW